MLSFHGEDALVLGPIAIAVVIYAACEVIAAVVEIVQDLVRRSLDLPLKGE